MNNVFTSLAQYFIQLTAKLPMKRPTTTQDWTNDERLAQDLILYSGAFWVGE
jgi:hypothetical protein